jgi:hypothetical protein
MGKNSRSSLSHTAGHTPYHRVVPAAKDLKSNLALSSKQSTLSTANRRAAKRKKQKDLIKQTKLILEEQSAAIKSSNSCVIPHCQHHCNHHSSGQFNNQPKQPKSFLSRLFSSLFSSNHRVPTSASERSCKLSSCLLWEELESNNTVAPIVQSCNNCTALRIHHLELQLKFLQKSFEQYKANVPAAAESTVAVIPGAPMLEISSISVPVAPPISQNVPIAPPMGDIPAPPPMNFAPKAINLAETIALRRTGRAAKAEERTNNNSSGGIASISVADLKSIKLKSLSAVSTLKSPAQSGHQPLITLSALSAVKLRSTPKLQRCFSQISAQGLDFSELQTIKLRKTNQSSKIVDESSQNNTQQFFFAALQQKFRRSPRAELILKGNKENQGNVQAVSTPKAEKIKGNSGKKGKLEGELSWQGRNSPAHSETSWSTGKISPEKLQSKLNNSSNKRPLRV